MKNEYVTPEMQVERFVANTHVSDCGDTEKLYKFKCDIGNFSALYEETNGVEGLQTSKSGSTPADTKIWSSNYSYRYGCNDYHEASTNDEFAQGYTTYNKKTTKVVIWYEDATKKNMDDVHVTTKINMDEWDIIKS